MTASSESGGPSDFPFPRGNDDSRDADAPRPGPACPDAGDRRPTSRARPTDDAARPHDVDTDVDIDVESRSTRRDPGASGEPRRPAPTTVVPLRVLIFDRDPGTCAAAQRALTSAGYAVEVATNPTTLYRVIQSDAPPYDALVVDCGTGGIPAEQFARHMRAVHAGIAVAIAAGDVGSQRVPCDARLPSPYDPSSVVEIVRAAARAARERRRRPPDPE